MIVEHRWTVVLLVCGLFLIAGMADNGNVIFKKCGSKRCLTCPELVQSTTFLSSSTGIKHHCTYHFGNNEEKILTCTTTNCIYLLTCKKCQCQYIGETVQALRDRINGHRSSIDNDSNCFRVKEHFSEHCHNGFSVHIIGKLEGNGRTSIPKGKTFEIDSGITLKRRELESLWVRQVQTAYPYGMNVKMENIPNKAKHNSVFGLLLGMKARRKRTWSKQKVTEEGERNIIANRILAYFKLPFQSRFCGEIKKILFRIEKKSLYTLRDMLLMKFAENYEVNVLESSALYRTVLDLFTYKLQPFVKQHSSPKKKRPKLVCNIQFISKGVEMLHLPSIFRMCKSTVNFCSHKIPDVVYSFGNTIGRHIFNFKQTVMSYDGEKSLDDQYECICSRYSDFIDSSCGHVATGNLSIIENIKLRELLKKGPRYREPQSINPDSVFMSISSDLKEFLKKWSNKEKLAPVVFAEWYNQVIRIIRLRLEKMSDRYTFPKYSSTFNDPISSGCLNALKEHFVFVPVDKASKNISVICKRFYMQVLLDEMISNSATYSKLDVSSNELFDIHRGYLSTLKLTPPSAKIPYTYWTPKFHKPVLSQRFIVSFADCAIKPLAQKLSLALGMVLKQMESFGNMLYKCTGIKHYWIVNNSLPIIDYIKGINQRNAGRNITTYDFTTLYTKLEHGHILDCMSYIIDLAFKKAKAKFISVYNKSASWSTNPHARTFRFDPSTLKNSIKFILENSYFAIGSVCFQQSIGIPIGIDCAPAIANLSLFKYEYEFISKLIRSNYRRALKFNGCFRLMDDISAINSDGAFDSDRDIIYPSSLQLKKENEGHIYADILDLSITLRDNSFSFKLYDKRDKFNFEIVNYPDLSGNLSADCGYGVVKSELKRYAKLSSNFSDYIYRKDNLIKKLLNKHYIESKIDMIVRSIHIDFN